MSAREGSANRDLSSDVVTGRLRSCLSIGAPMIHWGLAGEMKKN
ncbi:MAG: hypothetical protein ABSA26_02335 [Thermoguttaceae bacterium]|jgi:hypothetical protein